MSTVIKKSSAKVPSKSSTPQGSAQDLSSKDIPSKEEVDVALNKIFDSVSTAIKRNENNVTLEGVDKTLAALFEAVNKVHDQGNNVKVPDFQKILTKLRIKN